MLSNLPKKDIKVILSDGHLSECTINAIKNYPNAISILDADTCRDYTMKVCPYIDYLICSEDFAQDYLKEELRFENKEYLKKQFEKINQLNNKHLVITLGEKGCLYKENGEIKRFEAYKTNVVDSCGAGDIFHGAFAYCLANNYDLEKTLQISSMASSIAVSRKGSQTSIPRLDEVMSKLLLEEK